MKDIEKIKSEDLACQVADANPGNYAIEQEVAQLVGATVPQPTDPSADDARELPAQLLVFLRRALLPIRTALRTAVAAIYAHLDSRCTDYTPAAYAPFTPTHHAYDPMGSTPRTLPNLLTALTAFAPRKISGGESNVPDGMSLLQLVCSRSTSITKIGDPYVWDVCYRDQLFNLCAALPGLNDLYLRCKRLTGYSYSGDLEWIPSQITKVNGSSDVFELPDLERFEGQSYNGCPTKAQNFKVWSLPKMVYSRAVFASNCTWVEEILAPSAKEIGGYAGAGGLRNYTNLRRIQLGDIVTLGDHSAESFTESPNLIDIELCETLTHSFSFAGWSPTNSLDASRTDLIEEGSTAENNLQQFLQNFKDHIALRLTSNGSGLTLTLSQAVFSAVIEGSSPICDDIKGIIEDKGWKVQDTNNNIFPTT